MEIGNGFCMMEMSELDKVNGGANVVQAVGGTLGIAVACWAPVALIAGAPLVAGGMVLVGVGAAINLMC